VQVVPTAAKVVPVETLPLEEIVPGKEMSPLLSSVALAEGVWEPSDPAPVIIAVLVSEAAEVTQPEQDNVFPDKSSGLSLLRVFRWEGRTSRIR
jgi:hypothetical protein